MFQYRSSVQEFSTGVQYRSSLSFTRGHVLKAPRLMEVCVAPYIPTSLHPYIPTSLHPYMGARSFPADLNSHLTDSRLPSRALPQLSPKLRQPLLPINGVSVKDLGFRPGLLIPMYGVQGSITQPGGGERVPSPTHFPILFVFFFMPINENTVDSQY